MREVDEEAGVDSWRPFATVHDDPQARRPKFTATPYVCKDPAMLPRRPWIYGRQLLRGSLSVTIAPGGVGKTTFNVGRALSLATGRPLLGKEVWGGSKRVWIVNLEDSELEIDYLIEAARKQWSIREADLGGRLFRDTALSGLELCIAREDQRGFRIIEPVVEALVNELRARRIDVLIIDPFVSSHQVSENDNGAIDAVAKRWARIAVQADCAVHLTHHTRKLANGEATVESSRGGVSLTDAARSVEVLNRMSEANAHAWGIKGEDRRRYFRVYDDKPNRAPPSSKSDWYYLASADLGNSEDGPGDSIPVALPWTPPDAFAGVTTDHLLQVQEVIACGEWRESSQTRERWVGCAIARVLELDLGNKQHKERIKELLKTWIHTGALKIDRVADTSKGRTIPFVRVGNAAQRDSSPL